MSKFLTNLNIRNQMYFLAGISVLGNLVLLVVATMSALSGASWSTIFQDMNYLLELSFILVSIVLVCTLAHILGKQNAQRAEMVVGAMGALAKGDLTKKIKIDGKDEFAWMCWEYTCARKGFTEVVQSIKANASQLAAAAEELSTITEQSSKGVVRQQSETQQVATAMNEMSATVQEVAKNAASAATEAQEADQQAKNGYDVVNETVQTINSLATEVKNTSEVIERLKGDSLSIGAVLDVIRDIAEQTNLLALNAAIEAARAGEQGRGFAVVADEVRTLASRTQQSTQEINEMIERLQSGANEAVLVMEQGTAKAENTVEQASKAGEALDSITQVVDNIKAMNMQIASAADEQSATAEEINRNIVNISEVADETSTGAQQTANASDELARLAVDLQEKVDRFQIL